MTRLKLFLFLVPFVISGCSKRVSTAYAEPLRDEAGDGFNNHKLKMEYVGDFERCKVYRMKAQRHDRDGMAYYYYFWRCD